MMSEPQPLPHLSTAVDAADVRHSWHPFTQMREYLDHPRLHIARAKSCWLFDTDGNRYFDGTASLWTNVHGHGDPDLDAALRAQLDQVAHTTLLGINHPQAAALAEELATLTNGKLSRCFFSDNGSNAVEIALKLSFQYWQLTGKPEKRGVIGLTGGYHGDTFGTMAVGDSGGFHERFAPWLFPAKHIPAPIHVECAGKVVRSDASQSLAALDALLAAEADRTACLILEPRVQGAAGMVQQPPGFVAAVAERCRRAGVHLILDEVFTGFGRLGALTACSGTGVPPVQFDSHPSEAARKANASPDRQDACPTTPDFLCLAKGLSAGYVPLAATLTRDTIHDAFLGSFSQQRAFYHGHTFSGNPLACAVARASLAKLRPLLASGRVAETIATLGAELESHFAGHPNVAEVRQLGLTGAIDLVPRDRNRRWPADLRAGFQVTLAARKHGLVIRPLADSVLIVPPVVATPDEVRHLARALHAALDDVLPSLESAAVPR
ncbi:MAG TPA: aminotransferase class III-fold pyridoxal phosphate-dependent enzyme [Verrucomicrobiae bacterium]|nr:aminotransferase class III-fold pyridoxal phosphate-dependent enzyme [Verrucomicrobiae bacterium]